MQCYGMVRGVVIRFLSFFTSRKGQRQFIKTEPLLIYTLNKTRLSALLLSISLFVSIIILLAFASSVLLLLKDTSLTLLRHIAHAPISAMPLLLTGIASLCFQLIVRPKLLDLLKALIVSTAFIMWGLDQLLPAGRIATTLGDVVIALYVVDLGWMMLDQLKQSRLISVQQKKHTPSFKRYRWLPFRDTKR